MLTREVYSCQNLHAEAADDEALASSSAGTDGTSTGSQKGCSDDAVNEHQTGSDGQEPLVSTMEKLAAAEPSKFAKNVASFDQISYLGSSSIENPVCEKEMARIMAEFNKEKAHDAIEVILVIPNFVGGIVRLYEQQTRSEISSFPIQRIRFCSRGQADSAERACFALSFTQPTRGPSAGGDLNQCHVFRCHIPEIAAKALLNFAIAFRNTDPSAAPTSLSQSPAIGNASPAPVNVEEEFQFESFLEIKEHGAQCPVDNNYFKLRRDVPKQVVVVMRQVSGPRPLAIKRCFGLLLAPGRNVRDADMHLLDIEKDAAGEGNRNFVVEGLWNPSSPIFDLLNTETPKVTRVCMTVAVDVILEGINEPVRFNIECKARIYQQFERFWNIKRSPVNEKYFITIKMDEENPSTSTDAPYKVVRCESATQRERASTSRLAPGTLRSPNKLPSQLLHLADENDSDGDEPLLSGSGTVNRECPTDVLSEWDAIIEKWKTNLAERPPELHGLIYNGVPDVRRGLVWQLLAKAYKDEDLVNTYRMLLDNECPSEPVILRDIHRTFPAHDYFKESNGVGQEGLYKISKAYSLYDEEVNYCQGQSFLAAALLLHMPEEEAFCVLVKIMYDYSLRDLFKQGFEALHLRFYQLERLMQDYAHDLHKHFETVGIETHMYASQWFLTLFTAKFPLQMVFFIIDLFLAEGINTIFHISLALLQDSKSELLKLDFEGILKYFRVALPRRYRTESNAKELIKNAVELKISHKKLLHYGKEYDFYKQEELAQQDPKERLERENLRLSAAVMRLERENDDLAHELVTSKIELRHKLDSAEDQLETALANVERITREYRELDEQFKTLREESDIVKDRFRREMERHEKDMRQAQSLNRDYKQIVSDHSKRIEELQQKHKEDKKWVTNRVSGCDTCTSALSDWIVESPRRRNGVDPSSPESTGPPLTILDLMGRLEEKQNEIHFVEMELAETKLALVQALCQNQEISHQIMSASMSSDSGANNSKPAWFKRTMNTFKEVGTSFKSVGGSQATSSTTNGHGHHQVAAGAPGDHHTH